MNEKIVVKEYEPRYFIGSKGNNYRIINFMGQLKVYKRFTKQISATEWTCGEKEEAYKRDPSILCSGTL